MKRIKSKLHKFGTYEVCKKFLSFVLMIKDTYQMTILISLAYFHEDLRLQLTKKYIVKNQTQRTKIYYGFKDLQI